MEECFHIVLLGKAGVGKSASANTILGREVFKSKTDFGPVTKCISIETGTVFGKHISVVDTPDILGSQEKITHFLQHSLPVSTPSLFLLVIKVGRFTEEEQKAVEAVETVLGPQRMKNCFLLFTGGDCLRTSLEDYISESSTSPLPNIVERFSRRIHLFNNNDKGEEQVRELLKKMQHIPTEPENPKGFTPSEQAETSITLQWNKVNNNTSFVLKFDGTETNISAPEEDGHVTHIVSSLTAGTRYTFSLFSVFENVRSSGVQLTAVTAPENPEGFRPSKQNETSITLQWNKGKSTSFVLQFDGTEENISVLDADGTVTHTVSSLTAGTEYKFILFSMFENMRSSGVPLTAVTAPTNPEEFRPTEKNETSIILQWNTVKKTSFVLQFSRTEENISAPEEDGPVTHTVSSLTAGTKYTFTLFSVFENIRSSGVQLTAVTETILGMLLKDLGLKQFYREKLTLSNILEINDETINDEPTKCKSDLSGYFLKKLMMVNVTARKIKYTSASKSNYGDGSRTDEFDLDGLLTTPNVDEKLNPLDLITALFLCSDDFVQQELALKMSMCQFSIPLLLPNCDTEQCTLMLWAMRDIVKKYRPPDLSETKGFIEERIVLSELPMVSFVRLGEHSLCKSEILNKLLNNPDDTFVHHNMECGNSRRRISDGLTEITWYLPCGNTNIDIFSEPIALANLRGDIASFETQFSFLCQTSTAVFVFFDQLDSECKLLTNNNHKAQIVLVVNQQSKNFRADSLKQLATSQKLTNSNILIKRKQTNDADFVKELRNRVGDVIKTQRKMSVQQMADVAHELGIIVDEDSPECQTGKKNADTITAENQNTLKYKDDQLPLQGQIWKELTCLEKEEFRLRQVGSENIENYKYNLREEINKLRKKQNEYGMSKAMILFINAISSKKPERCYFLKWMRINLDNQSRKKLSDLRDKYKKCKDSGNKKEIKEIDRQLSSSSLGVEHFFREMGQIYEASLYLPQTDPSRQQLQQLPRLCAQLLLDGFPLELVDGDASNIPLRWVRDVLSQLNDLVSPKNKILVVTVLGVQSTGKSTLLNTMFGVQFAVSSGRCTRGAFMLLIKVNEDFKKVINCDFVVIIDTEGLKSPELAKLDNSYGHDNELATLVVGLSDITIINIAMENSTEMKDILQIVVHAFLRMKEVSKKPKCLFVHQNVSDISAHEKNLRDRKLLLEQLNEMTQAAAKMEKKEKYKSFTDVMEYNPETGNCYIPGLWNGNPPMAPVNAGYSEAVYELKKNIIQQLGRCESTSHNILEFREWITSLWNAVKHENFIFSFRNSLVADAYMRLCTEYNKWEWEFKKEMYIWVTNAETRISNFGTVAATSEISDMKQFITVLKSKAVTELTKWETKILDNLKKYFEQTEGHVYLVEGYREEFSNSIKSLRRQTERSVFDQLTAAADIKQGMQELNKIKATYTEEIEKAVCALIDECRKKEVKMTDRELDENFDKMWTETLNALPFSEKKTLNIFTSVSLQLQVNLNHKGSHACELLSKKSLLDCGQEPFTYTQKGWGKNFVAKVDGFLPWRNAIKARKEVADSIISVCNDCVSDKIKRKTNYHDTYIQEILYIIDERLNKADADTDIDFEVSLKQHICGSAARKFQKMHEDFIQENDPYRCLQKNKDKFCVDFKDVFNERDQCQKKAEEFTNRCLRPAVEGFIHRSLGLDIVSKMKSKEEFSTRMYFQYTILLDLISKSDFESFEGYICSHENYVKLWISSRIKESLSSESTVFEFEDKHLKSCVDHINDAIKKAEAENTDSLKTFVEKIWKELGDKLVIPQDALDAFMVLNNADSKQFAYWLNRCVKEMTEGLREKFKKTEFEKKLSHLHVKPENELFNTLIGCGKQCPFCKVPCDAGGEAHTQHFASLHRPDGLGWCRWGDSNKLTTDICSSLVISNIRFCRSDTKNESHLYKEYKDIFPEWNIPPDGSLEASDYWKYVMAKYNKLFAKASDAEPADIPNGWKKITEQQAKESLMKSFNIKCNHN